MSARSGHQPRRRSGRRGSAAVAVLLACVLSSHVASAQPVTPAALVRAYPEELASFDGTDLIWRDGTHMPVSDGRPDKTLPQMLRSGSIMDMLRMPYPAGPTGGPPPIDNDPGRVRNRAFFEKMYGDCHRGEVDHRLVPVIWLPRSWGHRLMATSVNGVAHRLDEISRELDDLPDALKRYAYPPGGTYNCRTVADTGEPSLHAFGAAIDINVRFSDYWLWRRGAGYENRIPPEIVAIFEKHGFIWGGKWSHYDTMHFEYRPELLGRDGTEE